MSPQHPFERLITDSQHLLQRQNEYRYESTLVQFLLVTLGLSHYRTELAESRRRLEGVSRLTMADFNERFPEFPVVLQANRLNGLKLHACEKAFLPALFKNFRRAPFVDAYVQFHAAAVEYADTLGRAVGMVFPRLGVARGLIIHNSPCLESFHPVGSVLVDRAVSTDGDNSGAARKRSVLAEVDLCVQAFAPLVVAISKSNWRG